MLGFFSERKLKMDYNKIGIDAMQEGDFEKAAEAFTKAIEETAKIRCHISTSQICFLL